MTASEWFKLVSVGMFVIPCGVTLLVAILTFQDRPWLRALLAVGVGWLLWATYTVFVFNPAGISAGHEQGMDFPENHYDNNTTGIAVMFGWFYPFGVVLFYALVKWLWVRLSASNNSLNPDGPDGPPS